MISKETKTKAISMLAMGVSINEVAGEFDLPLPLVEEWNNNIPESNLIGINATTAALSVLAKSDLDDDLKPQLENAIVKTALEVAEKTSFAIYTNDIQSAQLCKLAADALSKLYIAVISKNQEAPLPDLTMSNDSVKLFSAMLKD